MGRILAATTGIVRATSTLATDDRCDGLDEFACLDTTCEFGRNGRHQRHRSSGAATEHDHTRETALEGIDDRLEEIRLRIPKVVGDQRDAVVITDRNLLLTLRGDSL